MVLVYSEYFESCMLVVILIDKSKPYRLYLPSGKITSCFPIDKDINSILEIILHAYKQAWIEQPPKRVETGIIKDSNYT